MTKDQPLPAPTVLLVDDEPSVTEVFRQTLVRRDYRILTANSAADGLDLLATESIDVVISDAKMPRMSGIEFLERVCQEYPEKARVLLTGDTDAQTAVEAINRAQVFRYLTKPCDPKDLAFCIDQALAWIEHGRTAGPAYRPPAADDDRSLDRALESLWIAFQPILSARRQEVFGYEALVRTGVHNPAALFSLAERLNRVLDVERTIRRALVDRLPALPDDKVLFVNLHPISLTDPEFASSANPLLPWSERVVLEVTERNSLHGTGNLKELVEWCRDNGFRIAVDDFGAGYAGLTSFALLVPNVVKFDMELIRGIDASSTKQKLVHSMANLCRDMGILTVAEGIEDPAEHAAVVELGCDLLQGFLYAQPEREFLGPGAIYRVV